MKTIKLLRTLLPAAAILFGGLTYNAFSQVSAPLPGTPGSNGPILGPGPVISAPGSPAGIGEAPAPAPEPNQGPAPAPGSDVYNPGPTPPVVAGGPWDGNWQPAPAIVVNAPLSTPNWQNSGVLNVMACGYDAQGVWRTIPLRVAYTYVDGQYDVNVLAAWNPWTDVWNRDVDEPAFNTSYFLNGVTYNFYTNLSTGTYYFNL